LAGIVPDETPVDLPTLKREANLSALDGVERIVWHAPKR
jgi:hypothetical protein